MEKSLLPGPQLWREGNFCIPQVHYNGRPTRCQRTPQPNNCGRPTTEGRVYAPTPVPWLLARAGCSPLPGQGVFRLWLWPAEDDAVTGARPALGNGHDLEACGGEFVDQDFLWDAVPTAVAGHALDREKHTEQLLRGEVNDRKPAARLKRLEDARIDLGRLRKVMIHGPHENGIAAGAGKIRLGDVGFNDRMVGAAPRGESIYSCTLGSIRSARDAATSRRGRCTRERRPLRARPTRQPCEPKTLASRVGRLKPALRIR